MTRKQIIILGVLGLLPFGFLIGAGFNHLRETGWLFWAWWPMFGCWALAYLLGWRWQKLAHRQVAEEPPPMHFTDRDQLAWKLVEDRIRKTDKLPPEALNSPHLYVDVAQQMAIELAKVYHPEASDPVGNLTIPEMLTVIELASHDLGAMARTYLPAGHLLTIDHLRQAKQAVKWYQRANKALWAVSALMDPIRTGIRFAASQAGLGKPMQLLQDNVFLWLYANFIRRMGHYFIELYSGRLKVGAERYRELLEDQASQPVGEGATIVVNDDQPAAAEARAVTIAVIGQVKAGKSSLINALLGERRAVTDVIPATRGVSRYELQAPGRPARLIFLDTVGYNQAGPAADEFETTLEAAQQSDVIFLVSHARNPARDSDVKLWQQLREWFVDRPNLKMPPVFLVLTHIDLLSPSLEWAPPYHWRQPTRLKEKNIAEAVAVAREQFGDGLATFVPLCTAEGKIHGVQEELLPALTEFLGQARAVAFLRCLEAEADERKIQRVVDQLLAVGKQLLFNAMVGK